MVTLGILQVLNSHMPNHQAVIMNETHLPVPCRSAIVIDPRWQLDDLVKAYANILYDNEHPENVTLQNTPAPVFRQFVIAAELGLKCIEGEHEGDIDVAIAAAEHGDWLTNADVTRTLDWLACRANERDLQMVYDVNSVGPYVQILNSDQLMPISKESVTGITFTLGASAEAEVVQGVEDDPKPEFPHLDPQHPPEEGLEKQDKQHESQPGTDGPGSPPIGSSSDTPILVASDDDDNSDSAQETTPPRKRRCSEDSLILESPSKKAKVKEEEREERVTSSHVATEVVTLDKQSHIPVSLELPTPPAHRRRWTASQQFAMLCVLYTVGYENADWEAIAARVNATNPQGQSKSKTRVKSAMRETHWTKFLQANDDGKFGHAQLTISFPDMSGPPTSTGAAWTSQQKQAIWFETFAFAERNVK